MANKFTTTPEEFLSKQAEEVSIESFQVPKGYRLKPLPKTERMHILVTTETRKAIKNIADRRGMSMNALLNEIIVEYVEANE